MEQLTWKDFEKFKPCYNPGERYGEWSGTVIDLLQKTDIPAKDRIWVAININDDKINRLFTCKCVREIWHLITDERSRNAVQVAERFAIGQATKEELAAASDAAWAAARAAASDADWAAARAAAWAAAWAAASAAASDAAWATARAAAWAAAWAADRDAARAADRNAASAAARKAARNKQIKILINLITLHTHGSN